MAKLREQAETCRRLAGDEEIERRLKALADEYEARAVKSEAHDPSNKK